MTLYLRFLVHALAHRERDHADEERQKDERSEHGENEIGLFFRQEIQMDIMENMRLYLQIINLVEKDYVVLSLAK